MQRCSLVCVWQMPRDGMAKQAWLFLCPGGASVGGLCDGGAGWRQRLAVGPVSKTGA